MTSPIAAHNLVAVAIEEHAFITPATIFDWPDYLKNCFLAAYNGGAHGRMKPHLYEVEVFTLHEDQTWEEHNEKCFARSGAEAKEKIEARMSETYQGEPNVVGVVPIIARRITVKK